MIELEDLRAGKVLELGTLALSKEEIIEFARRFDPQPFHVDEVAAKASIYGGLIASGWHTGSACMRLVVDNFLSHTRSMGSPGLEQLRWLKPVRPGEALKLRATILEVRPSTSHPDRGSVRLLFEVENPAGEIAVSMVSGFILGRSPRTPDDVSERASSLRSE
jgi:acyl dehydratase